MSRHPRRAAARDANEKKILRALRQIPGLYVTTDCPLDLLIFFRGQTFVVEVKDGAKAPSGRALTKAEEDFMAWARTGGPVIVARCGEELFCCIGIAPCRAWSGDSAMTRWKIAKVNNHNQPMARELCGCGGVDDPPWLDEWRKEQKETRR